MRSSWWAKLAVYLLTGAALVMMASFLRVTRINGSERPTGDMTLTARLFGWTKLVRCQYVCEDLSSYTAEVWSRQDVRERYDAELWRRRERKSSRRSLLAITTCNQWHITETLLRHLVDSYDNAGVERSFDVVVIDDNSEDGTPARVADSFGPDTFYVVTKEKPRGLTHSWNVAYQIFKGEGYENFFLVNNDLIIPRGALERMAEALETDSRIDELGPLYHEQGLGAGAKAKNYPYQNVAVTRPDSGAEKLLDDLPLSVDEIQRRVELVPGAGGGAVSEAPMGMLGSFLGFNRRIIAKEIQPHHLFCPSLVNLGQEAEMRCRTGDKAIHAFVSREAFVFHSKGGTLGGYGQAGRNSIMECHSPAANAENAPPAAGE